MFGLSPDCTAYVVWGAADGNSFGGMKLRLRTTTHVSESNLQTSCICCAQEFAAQQAKRLTQFRIDAVAGGDGDDVFAGTNGDAESLEDLMNDIVSNSGATLGVHSAFANQARFEQEKVKSSPGMGAALDTTEATDEESKEKFRLQELAGLEAQLAKEQQLAASLAEQSKAAKQRLVAVSATRRTWRIHNHPAA